MDVLPLRRFSPSRFAPPPSKFAWTQCLYCVFDIFLASTCELKCHSSSANHKLLITVPAGLRIAQPCRYCFYSLAQKWVFCPAGATRCPNKQLSRLSGQNVGIQPQKLSKFWILARNFYLTGDSFAIFLRNFQRLYASIVSLYVFSLAQVVT